MHNRNNILLIDCDFRKPQIHHRLGINNLKGFSDLFFDKSWMIVEGLLGILWVIGGGCLVDVSEGVWYVFGRCLGLFITF